MGNADMLDWIIENRGEPECERLLCELSAKVDAELVQETLCHVWAGFYDAEDPEELLAEQIRKHGNAVRRDRKIAENRKHQRNLKLRKGEIVNDR